MSPQVQAFCDPATSTVTYLVSDPESRQAAIIDPVLDFDAASGTVSTTSADAVLAAVHGQGLHLAMVLETHAHADHLSAADYIRRRTGASVVIGARITEVQKVFAGMFEATDVSCDGGAFDSLAQDGQAYPLGGLTVRVMATPGHTPACVTYLIGDAAFVGDTLFMPDYGTARADFPGGDPTILYRSIRRILALPQSTLIYVGHDYLPAGRSDIRWQSSVAEQRAANIHIHDGVDEDAFVALRRARDATLAAPRLIWPALQVNIRAGAMPPATPAGHVFLKLPVKVA
jgi:glyoxylase-like metal-dependent hydrolase (beta-lactamase superfamily II)